VLPKFDNKFSKFVSNRSWDVEMKFCLERNQVKKNVEFLKLSTKKISDLILFGLRSFDVADDFITDFILLA
jgi:hypothetical protein